MLSDYSEQNMEVWESFLLRWGKQFENVKYIIAYLNTYADVLSKIKLKNIIDIDYLESTQSEWIQLISKFTNPIEIEFFKECWIPIERDSYDYFMDISDERYSIFEIHYFFYEPYNWYKKFITKDIAQILLAPDTGLDLPILLANNDKIRWENVAELFEERRRLAYSGKLPVDEVKKDEIILEKDSSTSIVTEVTESYFKILGVSSIIVGLLPFHLDVQIKCIQHKYGNPYKSFNDVKNIRDMVFYLRDHGMRCVESYRIEFANSCDGYIEYNKNSFIIFHSNRQILNGFKKRCKLMEL
jgi:hypothetical protein